MVDVESMIDVERIPVYLILMYGFVNVFHGRYTHFFTASLFTFYTWVPFSLVFLLKTIFLPLFTL